MPTHLGCGPVESTNPETPISLKNGLFIDHSPWHINVFELQTN